MLCAACTLNMNVHDLRHERRAGGQKLYGPRGRDSLNFDGVIPI